MTTDQERDLSKITPLRFGTSGLRALVTEMTDLECYINTRGFCGFLRTQGYADEGQKVSIGGDRRASTPRIMAAVMRAVRDSGLETDLQGLLPSPALALHAMTLGQASVMVTGSHIPETRNGIKFTRPDGEVLKRDEAEILTQVAIARTQEYALNAEETLFDVDGAFKTPEPLSEASDEAAKSYVKRYLDALPPGALAGMKIVLYEHSAVGRDLFGEILTGLGAEVFSKQRSDVFVPIDTEKLSAQTHRLLRAFALSHRATAIFSSDGDSDRPLVADERGRFLPGDKLGALAAFFLRPDFAALPISTNAAVVTALENHGVDVALTRIGSPHVIAAMDTFRESHPRHQLCAWEANGGFLLGSAWRIGDSDLKALPTRDAILPFLCVLLLAKEEKRTLSELIDARLPPRQNSADVVDAHSPGCATYTAALGKAIVSALSPPEDLNILSLRFDSEGEVQAARDGLRLPLNEADLEASREVFAGLREKVATAVPAEDGFEAIEMLDYTDGVRVTFAHGEVVHLRPSGNAPEFRFYAEAETETRVQALLSKRERVVARLITQAS